MENKKTAVFGIYTTVAAADLATDSLVKAGFSASDISALLPGEPGAETNRDRKSHQSSRGCDSGRQHRCGSWRSTGLVGGCWHVGNTGAWAFHRRRSDHGGTCRARSWRGALAESPAL